MNVAEFCLRNNATTFVGVVLLVLAGVLSFIRLPKGENPDFTVRTAIIITQFPGASPLKVEELVTDKLEEKVRELADAEKVKSQSLAGVSIITVELYESTPVERVRPTWNKLRNKVEEVAPTLPAGSRPPAVNDDFGDVFGMVLALRSDGFSYREMKDEADDLRDRLLKIVGVAKVDLYGTQEERIFVEFSNALLAERDVSPFLLAGVIDSQNIVQPSGDALTGRERILIESSGEYDSLSDIRKTSFRAPGSDEAITLGDLTTVSRAFVDPPQSLVTFDGDPSIVLAVNMAVGGNILEIGKRGFGGGRNVKAGTSNRFGSGSDHVGAEIRWEKDRRLYGKPSPGLRFCLCRYAGDYGFAYRPYRFASHPAGYPYVLCHHAGVRRHDSADFHCVAHHRAGNHGR